MTSNKRNGFLGPLTSTFTPTGSCTQILSATPTHFLGQRCSDGEAHDDSQCWPPQISSFWTTDSEHSAFNGGGFYSPGLMCPLGWTSACTAVATTEGQRPMSIATSFNFQFAPEAGETVIGCCPLGYSCTTNDYAPLQTCALVTSSVALVATCDSTGTNFVGQTALQLTAPFNVIHAPLIQLNYRQTDLPAANTGNPSASASRSTGLNTECSATQVNNARLNSGAKAGIGVGSAMLVVLALFTGMLMLRLRKLQKQLHVTNHGINNHGVAANGVLSEKEGGGIFGHNSSELEGNPRFELSGIQ